MIRVGQGLDVHAFDEQRPLVLGGVRISDRGGLAGHSDADAALHALTDAILGSIGAGDIGELFPSEEPRWKGAASAIFVREALRLLAERDCDLQNVDITLIAQKPRLAPHKGAIRAAIAHLLSIPEGRVSVKATTTDHLGFTGRGEGICVMAIVTVEQTNGTPG
jgi:2-C-methyl-D-erythritol 4-phosphate cytidylyltransferase/2-C-methyl-D-erythritol 2,4-cyclodiphosphate synthase